MGRHLIPVLGALVIGFGTFSTAAQAQMVCGDRGSVVAGLESDFSEAPISMGLASNGSIIEVFASNDHTWTIVMTRPDGTSCVLMAGENWENLPTRVAGLGT